ncbi:hypothetical protein [Aneurinibacillus tyrosinisolvens]|uniref:hypothetical protein n=1 Tax=Aneurinibacillus tyrosinisolvens TaxID=1443435 RepID=UPI00069C1915|nr:hypothetical protein [Aneurinibacillus tyrosinisolvens]
MQRRKVSVLLLLFLFITTISVQAQENPAFAVVRKYIDTLNQHNWNTIPQLWVKERRKDLADQINSKENQEKKLGFFNIKKAKLVAWKELPPEFGQIYIPPHYVDKFEGMRYFYVAVDYEVHKQNKRRINGLNYFIIVVAKENGEWKIALTPGPPVTHIIHAGYGFGTDDEKTYDERRAMFFHNR